MSKPSLNKKFLEIGTEASKFSLRDSTDHGKLRTSRVRLFPFTYARFATKQQECLDEDSEAEVECWKLGRAVSRVSPRFIVQWSRESRNGTPVVILLTTVDLIACLPSKKRDRRKNRDETRGSATLQHPVRDRQYGDNPCWMFVSLGFSFSFQTRETMRCS